MERITSAFVLASILSLVCGPGFAEGTRFKQPVLDGKQCKFPEYPKSALRKDQEGLDIVGVQVDQNGAVLDTKILLSSGSADLDQAAQAAFRKCAYQPGMVNDQPVTMWMQVQYLWSIDPSNGKWFNGLRQAALDGDVQARYALGVMLEMPRRTETEKDAGLHLVISAAEAGEPMAQVSMAARYESGKRIPRDIAEAHRWYAKAAAQGNVVAMDHLRLLGDDH